MTMMADILVADTAAKGQGLGLGLRLLRSCRSTCNFSITDYCTDHISAMIQPYDAVAPPPVKPSTHRIPRRTLLRRKRRTKRRLSGDDEGFFFGDGGDGPFGGGGGGGGGSFGGSGGGWNFNRFRDESSPDPAFDFVYQVLSWIMLLNCLHFAFKKIVRIAADGSIVDSDRGKVPTRLAPVC